MHEPWVVEEDVYALPSRRLYPEAWPKPKEGGVPKPTPPEARYSMARELRGSHPA